MPNSHMWSVAVTALKDRVCQRLNVQKILLSDQRFSWVRLYFP